ncbi:MAG: cobyric acid synthase [Victivallaceae bacterium]|nr:cobyric acid synthase [Victivallaceae bacterium]
MQKNRIIAGHGGNIVELAKIASCKPEAIMDFSSSINPLGLPDFVRSTVNRELESVTRYPTPNAAALLKTAATVFNINETYITAGNGSSQLIFALPRALKLKKALIPVPAYIDYEKSCRLTGMDVELLETREADNFAPTAALLAPLLQPDMLVFIGHPGNPAGSAMPTGELRSMIADNPETTFIIDEAFADFCEPDFSLLPKLPDNAIVLRSLTKFFAIPGMRAGLCFASPEISRKLSEYLPPWSVNTLTEAVAIKLLTDGGEYSTETLTLNKQLKTKLTMQLNELTGFKVYPCLANYLLVKTKHANENFYCQLLTEHRIALRNCANFHSLDETFFRIGLRSEKDNDFLVAALTHLTTEKSNTPFYFRRQKRKPSLMLQGTCSNAGKSILTAAFCRILLQDGYSVAPFKSQNMALNSYVTANGEEMGRAQVVQAEACRLDPDVRMNPVLLKPSSDTGAQVIYMGHPIDTMNVKRYFSAKAELFDRVKTVYDSLEADYEVIVLEGAGSPGEMNLKKADIVNMNMAQYAESAVMLTGDIDRGGTYASFIGTVGTFNVWEKKLLKGFIVNKFRGDASLLQDAHDYVFDYTGVPVLGVIPYIHDIGLPEEDSVSFSFTGTKKNKHEKTLDIALVGLGHIANFTDFTPFESEPDIVIRKVLSVEELGKPDIIILPGSKNVISDLEKMRQRGLDQAVIELVNTGTWLIGICGGLQMAGATIADPNHIESKLPMIDGLGLLPLKTVLATDKHLARSEATWLKTGRPLSGYEIHHGVTTCSDDALVSIESSDGRPIGFAADKIWLTYLHGVFDDDQFRREFIDMVRIERDLPPLVTPQSIYNTEAALNRVADIVRNNVELKQIYKAMGL